MQIFVRYETNGKEKELTSLGYTYHGDGWYIDTKPSYLSSQIKKLWVLGIPEATIKNILESG